MLKTLFQQFFFLKSFVQADIIGLQSIDFRERAATFNHGVRGALSPPHTSRAPGYATQDHARGRDSNAVA